MSSNKNFFTFLLAAILVISLGVNIYLYYHNYVRIPSDHPNSRYAYLFPGLNYNPAKGFDFDQELADSFLVVLKNGGYKEKGEHPYWLLSVSRQGCRKLSGVSLSPEQTIDFAPYENKPVLIREYEHNENSHGIKVKKMDVDTFVLDRMKEYKLACRGAFDWVKTE